MSYPSHIMTPRYSTFYTSSTAFTPVFITRLLLGKPTFEGPKNPAQRTATWARPAHVAVWALLRSTHSFRLRRALPFLFLPSSSSLFLSGMASAFLAQTRCANRLCNLLVQDSMSCQRSTLVDCHDGLTLDDTDTTRRYITTFIR
jgi:hypothetical protein